jgi:hypothetical protein
VLDNFVRNIGKLDSKIVDYPGIYGELKPETILAAGIFTEKEKEETCRIQRVQPEHCWPGPDWWLNTWEAANLTGLG